MEKRTILKACMLCVLVTAFEKTNAQWNGTTVPTVTTSSFVGIGTLSPTNDLNVEHPANSSGGTSNPIFLVNSNFTEPGAMTSAYYSYNLMEIWNNQFYPGGPTIRNMAFFVKADASNTSYVGINKSSAVSTLDVGGSINADYSLTTGSDITDGGNLSVSGIATIGTGLPTPAGYNLYVANGILTEKLKVASHTGTYWSDFVFNKDYKMMSLHELEAFVKKNKHLPDVPSAAEVATNGIDVATMDATLLQKVEELTLYMIEQQKTIDRQQKQIAQLQQKLTK